MFGKRVAGGGRRRAMREKLTTAAVVSTVQNSRAAVLTDLSSTGARVSGDNLPAEGQTVSLKLESLRAFGNVAWSKDGQCGILFESALAHMEVEKLKKEIGPIGEGQQSVEVMLAYEDWNSGFTR